MSRKKITVKSQKNGLRSSPVSDHAIAGFSIQNGTLLKGNKAFTELFGKKVIHFRDFQKEFGMRCVAEDRQEFNKCLEKFRQNGTGTGELRFRTPQCGEIWKYLTIKKAGKGKLQNILFEIDTIDLFNDRLKPLKKQNDDLRHLIYTLIHDLKGPIVSTRGLISLIIAETPDEKYKHQLENILSSLRSSSSLIDSVINATHLLDSDSIFQKIDLKSMLRSIIDSIKGLEEMKTTEVAIQIKGNNFFKSNPILLKSIFYNLIFNAVKFGRPNTTNKVTISVNTGKDAMAISIMDTGSGIPESALPNIYKIFYRLNNKKAGSGLGLFIVENCVNRLNGSIKLKSKVNSGTEFKIKLPIIKQ